MNWIIVGMFLINGGWELIVHGDQKGEPTVYSSGAACEVDRLEWAKKLDELVAQKKFDGYLLTCVARGAKQA